MTLITETESFSILQTRRFSCVPISKFPDLVKEAENNAGSTEKEY